MEKFQETYNEWSKHNVQMYKDSLEYLKTTLAKLPNQSIDIDDRLSEIPSITFYGNHPEYDANPFSCVSSVYIKNDEIYIACEDTDEFPANEISAWELYTIADAVEKTIEKNWDIEE